MRPLEHCDVTFEMPYPAYNTVISKFTWAPGSDDPRFPAAPGEDRYLNWNLRAQDQGLNRIDPTKAVSRIVLPAGTLTARDVFRNREVPSVRPILWELWEDGPIRALACDVKLTVRGLWDSPVLSITNQRAPETERICITPSADGVARLAFTNLPELHLPPDSHLHAFQSFAPHGETPEIAVPIQLDDIATMGSECGVMFFYGEADAEKQPIQAKLQPPPDLPHLDAVHAPKAWSRGYVGDLDTTVAIFDTGIDIREGAARRSMGDDVEPPRVQPGWEPDRCTWFDDVGHGTSVASLVGGRYVATLNPRGIAPCVSLANFKIGLPTDTSNAWVRVEHLLAAVDQLIERNGLIETNNGDKPGTKRP